MTPGLKAASRQMATPVLQKEAAKTEKAFRPVRRQQKRKEPSVAFKASQKVNDPGQWDEA